MQPNVYIVLPMTSEEWLVEKVGAYLPGAYEEVVDTLDAYVLTDKVSTAHGLSGLTQCHVQWERRWLVLHKANSVCPNPNHRRSGDMEGSWDLCRA